MHAEEIRRCCYDDDGEGVIFCVTVRVDVRLLAGTTGTLEEAIPHVHSKNHDLAGALKNLRAKSAWQATRCTLSTRSHYCCIIGNVQCSLSSTTHFATLSSL